VAVYQNYFRHVTGSAESIRVTQPDHVFRRIAPSFVAHYGLPDLEGIEAFLAQGVENVYRRDDCVMWAA
jgi:hypothetical protein